MAIVNWEEVNRLKNNKESFDKLMELITSTDDGKLHELYSASEYIKDMERTIDEQNKEIKKYSDFFVLLKNLLPEGFHSTDIIG